MDNLKNPFIELVNDKINDLKRDLTIPKQGHVFYERTQYLINELIDLRSDMQNINIQ